MKRSMVAVLLVPLVCGGACAHGATSRTVADGIAPPGSAELRSLPQGQRYRFVSPEAFAGGLGTPDEVSYASSGPGDFPRAFAQVMRRARWVESADSAEYELTVFTTARPRARDGTREMRIETVSSMRRCAIPATPTDDVGPCTDVPSEQRIDLPVEQWVSEYETFHLIRRRSDGAVRVWRSGRRSAALERARITTDLRRMLAAAPPG